MACPETRGDLMERKKIDKTKILAAKHSRIGKFSKGKGSSFERVVCSKLSLWMSRGMRSDYFWRASMSGGRATLRFKKGLIVRSQHGDIAAVQPEGDPLTRRFFIECKAYAK